MASAPRQRRHPCHRARAAFIAPGSRRRRTLADGARRDDDSRARQRSGLRGAAVHDGSAHGVARRAGLHARGGGDELAAAAADSPVDGRRSRRPAAERVDSHMGSQARHRDPRRRPRRLRATGGTPTSSIPSPLALAYSEHLAPLVAARTAGLVDHEERRCSSTTCSTWRARPVRPRDVPARPRAHGPAARGAGRRVCSSRSCRTASRRRRTSRCCGRRGCRSRSMRSARYLDRGRRRALVGGVAALLAQQLSCGYYLVYFSPFVALYLAWELTARRRWRDRRLLLSLGRRGASRTSPWRGRFSRRT